MRKCGLIRNRAAPTSPLLKAAFIQSKAPDVCLRQHLSPKFKMFDNDTLNDCAAAGIGNSLIAATAIGGAGVDIPDKNVIDFYSKSTGYNPSNPATDRGATSAGSLSFACQNGFYTKYWPFFLSWGSVNPRSINSMANAIVGLGTVSFGLALAESDMAQINQSDGVCLLTKDNDDYGDTTPGSAGGHFALGWEYSGLGKHDEVTLITWGGTSTRATWEWILDRAFESHGILWRELSMSNKYITGQEVSALVKENNMYQPTL